MLRYAEDRRRTDKAISMPDMDQPDHILIVDDDETIAETPEAVLQQLREVFPERAPGFADYPAPRYKKRERVSYTPDFA